MFLKKPLELDLCWAHFILVPNKCLFSSTVWYLCSKRFVVTTVTDLQEDMQLSWQNLFSQFGIFSWCQVPILVFEERKQAASSSVLPSCHSNVFLGGTDVCIWHSATLPAWECTGTWKALIAIGGFGDEESNLTLLFCSIRRFIPQGKSAGGLEERITNWH